MTEETPRSRTVTWDDPALGAEQARTMAGIDYIRAMAEGRIPPPPIVRLMRMDLISAEVGSVVFTCEPDESMYNPIGTVHGGLVCTLLDSVVGCAVHTTLPAGQAYTSLDLTVNYLRPIFANTGTITATGVVTRPGTRAAFATGEVRDAQGKLLATASSSLLVFPVPA